MGLLFVITLIVLFSLLIRETLALQHRGLTLVDAIGQWNVFGPHHCPRASCSLSR